MTTARSVVRSTVRKLLQSSDAFRELPADKQGKIEHDTVRVASYMADPNGVLSRGLRVRNNAAEAGSSRAASTATARKPSRARRPASAYLAMLRDPRVLDASMAATLLLESVDFPDFVGDLIRGVFQAIVDASIEQMNAYADLVEQVAETVEGLERDGITDAHAKDWLAQWFPCEVELDDRHSLCWRVEPQLGLKHIASMLLLPRPAASQRDLIAAARRSIAAHRQQILSTMVLLGINRVVVTDGKISARGRRTNG